MSSNLKEKTLVQFLSFGALAVTIFMVSNGVTDPVNAPKFFVLGAVGVATLAILLNYYLSDLWATQRVLLVISLLFIVFSMNSLVFSNAPLSQNLYGSYGRNNGLIAYISLLVILLAASLLREESSYLKIVKVLFVSGIINVAYCLWVLAFGDFMSWDNTYNNLLGTFGNPNFIGSFLAIISVASFVVAIDPSQKKRIRLILGGLGLVSMLLMFYTDVQQGRIIFLLGVSIALGLSLRSRFNRTLLTSGYFSFLFLGIVIAIFGVFQRGPLAPYIYQYTFSLRLQYWKAGINTGIDNLFTGVGYDSFGDWYRRMREPQALITPGENITTNAAHNVFIDFFAFGGLPLFIAYLSICTFTMYAIFSRFKNESRFNSLFIVMSVSWIGYQVQSLVSINQLGLAIWGWLLGGLIIGYVRFVPIEGMNQEKVLGNKKWSVGASKVVSPQLVGGLGLMFGALIAVPPFSADLNLRSAQATGNAEMLVKAMSPTYLHPQNTNTYVNSIISLEQAGLNDLALQLTRDALKFNSESFETWRVLYFLIKSDESDKALAIENMSRLDPLNKNATAVPK